MRRIVLSALATTAAQWALASSSVTILATFSGGTAIPQGVSETGSVVGFGPPATGSPTEALLWLPDGTLVRLSPNVISRGSGVSHNGEVIVGTALLGNSMCGAVWSADGTMSNVLSITGGYVGYMYCSGDGLIMLGDAHPPGGAFRWTETNGFQFFAPVTASNATAASYDGSTVVGSIDASAYLWKPATGLQTLGTTAQGMHARLSLGISSTGQVIVGLANSSFGSRAFRYAGAGDFRTLPSIPNSVSTYAASVAADGDLIGGFYQWSDAVGRGAVWHPSFGVVDIEELAMRTGGNIPDGWHLGEVTFISPNGRFLVGYGSRNNNTVKQPYRLELDRQFVKATQFQIAEGFHFDGLLAAIQGSDDTWVRFFNDESSLGAEIIVSGNTSVSNPSALDCITETSVARAGLVEAVYAKHNQNGYVPVGGTIASTTDTTRRYHISNASDFVAANGTVRTKIRWMPLNDEDPAQDGWVHDVDQVYWETFF